MGRTHQSEGNSYRCSGRNWCDGALVVKGGGGWGGWVGGVLFYSSEAGTALVKWRR